MIMGSSVTKSEEKKEYYDDGKLKHHYHIKNKLCHGEFIHYRTNGMCSEICNYNNGRLHGKCISYHNNGFVHKIINYDDERFHGEFREYYNDGIIKKIQHYDNSVLSGKSLHYHNNGNLHVESHYSNGINSNFTKEYNSDNLLICHIVYHDYKFISCSIFKNRPNEICAQYDDNKLYYYGIKYNICHSAYSNHHTSRFIYYVKNNFVCIDLSVINPIRSIQKRFRQKFNSKRLFILNQFLINPISLLVLSY